MKAVILAGGLGTRISEETTVKPKPMIEIGGMPILWHILKIYSASGINEFVICLGYKGYVIKEFFANYALHTSDVTFNMKNGEIEVHASSAEPWVITLVDTGYESMTGGRLKRVGKYVDQETFCFTYGDGLADIDIRDSIDFHRRMKTSATITAVQPPSRFGTLRLDGDKVSAFIEKPEGQGGWINGGFFVLEPIVLDYLEGSQTIWERDPLERLAAEGNLSVYKHKGFFQPMDTQRDHRILNELWDAGKAPWKLW